MTILADAPDIALDHRDEVSKPDGLNHLARSAEITAAIVNGGAITAVCGVRIRPRGQGGGSTGRRGLPLCASCDDILNFRAQLKALDEATPEVTA